MASSSSSSLSSTSSSSSRAAASSSPAPADAAPAPGRIDDAAFPALGTAPPRPPRSRSGAATPRRTTSADRQRGRQTIIGLPLSLYGRRGVAVAETAEERDAAAETAATDEKRDAAAETAATDEECDATAEKTSATAEAGDTAAGTTVDTAEAGDAAPGTTSTAVTISARPPICATPGSFSAEAAVLSGAPTLLPAVQAFGGYSFGSTFGDLFHDLELRPPTLQVEPPPLYYQPPPPRFQVQRLQAPGYVTAPRALVPLQGPPPHFAPPRLAHYASAMLPMQFAARPQHMRFHVYAPGRPALFVDVHWHYHGTPPPLFFGPRYAYRPTPPPLPYDPQGALQRYAYPPVPPVGHVGSPCWDCQARPAAMPFPCGHVFLCRPCYKRRISCPCCAGRVPAPF